LETLRVLSLRGARVIAAARTLDKARTATFDVSRTSLPVACELSDPGSVTACVQEVKNQTDKLDAIVCNAGIMALPQLLQISGYEAQFFTNHIGHFILVTGLLDHLADLGRVVMLSSDAHRTAPAEGVQFDNLSGDKGYQAWRAYGQSKLANLLFAKELARRLPKVGQSANAVHPGVIKTKLQRSMPKLAQRAMQLLEPVFLKTIEQGAATQCYVAVHPGATQSGEYFADCNVKKPRSAARDPALALRLWEVSERIAREVTA
jgi:WW domain-containing oxidoreductase